MVELSREHNFLVVADEVYQLLGYTGAPPSPMAKYTEAATVLSLGSFSKILAPGLRLGWIQAHGQASAAIFLPPYPALVGLTIHTAFLTFTPAVAQPLRSISNTVSFQITT